ncbi:MAG: thioesterase [Roseitalea sp.]|jgi:medium-chain acyl-[acyl-carrier-protein] hydrolase|nr:thioesterase [Roseitalea sp.]MBO6720997.1 thioesterase [Roseitalea sp.]MBO6742931.1 thioesterase [Roseitalea sp.]
MTAWVHKPKPNSVARSRLFCIPFAGGSASVFQNWPEGLPGQIEVCALQMPGRQSHASAAPFNRMSPLVHAMCDALRDLLDLPYAIFGNCTGSLIAYEVAVRMGALDLRPPDQLIVSCSRAAHLPDRDAPIHALPRDELRAELDRLGGTPEQVIAHPELLDLVLPVLRADFELAETYRHRERPALSVPIHALYGQDDPIVSPEEVEGWGVLTDAGFSMKALPGGHYLIDSHAEALLSAVTSALSPGARPARSDAVQAGATASA